MNWFCALLVSKRKSEWKNETCARRSKTSSCLAHADRGSEDQSEESRAMEKSSEKITACAVEPDLLAGKTLAAPEREDWQRA
jgi:hypothetical protein